MATTWTSRIKPTTNWDARKRPVVYALPLEWVNGIVHDENNEIIYILGNNGKEIPLTKWTPRPVLNN